MQVIYQNEVAECGYACLAMTLSHLGRATEIRELSAYRPVSANGLSLTDLYDVATEFGLAVEAYRFGADDVSSIKKGSILHFGGAHFVVFEKCGRGHVRIIDPASGRRALPDCFAGPLEQRQIARWPAVLEPWLSPDVRNRALAPAWLPACAGHGSPEGGLKIVGASTGEVLRRTVKDEAPLIRLEVRGKTEGEVIWLVNGRNMGRRPARAGYAQRLEQPGRYDITAMDDQGRYDRVSLSVR